MSDPAAQIFERPAEQGGGALAFRHIAGKGARLVWLHGWGQDHRAFGALMSFIGGEAEHVAVDFPGFGGAPPPPGPWGTEDFGALLGDFLATLPAKPTVLIGHSFGVRVAIRLTASKRFQPTALVFIAGAGLKRRRSPAKRARAIALRLMGRGARFIDRLAGTSLHRFYAARFGSADYRAAGALRPTFVKVVNEDLTSLAEQVSPPALLIYGENDTETPPAFGQQYRDLMPEAELLLLPGHDHYSVLGANAHQVKSALKRFLTAHDLMGC